MPTITWTDNAGNRIINGQGRYSIEKYGRVLRIKNLVESDEKSYTCVGVNKIGRAEGTMRINVTCTLIFQVSEYFSARTDLSVTLSSQPNSVFDLREKSEPSMTVKVNRLSGHVSWTLY